MILGPHYDTPNCYSNYKNPTILPVAHIENIPKEADFNVF